MTSKSIYILAPGYGNFLLFSNRNLTTETSGSYRDEELEKSLEIDVSMINVSFLD